MVRLFRAEWRKAAGHRWLAGFLIWIFPVSAGAVAIVAILAAMNSREAAIAFGLDRARWTDMAGVWSVLSEYPANIIGRMPILAFIATLFAGEYQWGTWKNLVPRAHRTALVLAKFTALSAFVISALIAMSLITGAGNAIAARIAGFEYGPALNADNLAAFGRDYSIRAALAFTSTLIVAAIAAFAALLTRRVIGGSLVGIFISIIEPNTLLLLVWLSGLLQNPELIDLYRFTPTFSVGNINAWIQFGQPMQLGLPIPFEEVALGFSLAVVGLWTIGLITLVAILFQRQDITT
jgi:hypothetical protein